MIRKNGRLLAEEGVFNFVMKKWLRDIIGITKLHDRVVDIIKNENPRQYGVLVSPWFHFCLDWLHGEKAKTNPDTKAINIYAIDKVAVYKIRNWFLKYKWIKRDEDGKFPPFRSYI